MGRFGQTCTVGFKIPEGRTSRCVVMGEAEAKKT